MTDTTTNTAPRKINYRSDFVAVLELADAAGKSIPFPDCDFEATFWTGNANRKYAISRRGDVLTNCRREPGGGIRVIFDRHGMGVGELKWEPKFRLPDGEFPDGYQDVMRPMPLGVILVTGPGDLPSAAEIAVTLPYIKGDAFTYDDFTPEQLADLRRPATEAASDLSDIKKALAADEQARTKAETERQAAEHTRGDNEGKRIADETARQTAEEQRSGNETARTAAEKIRADAEALRVKAEELRAEAEKLRDEAEKLRISAEEARKAAEAQRVTDEKKRKSAEDTRVANETARKSAEDTRSANETTRQDNETTRQNNETTRTANENARVSAEQSRVAAEEARAKAFQAFESRIKALEDKRVILLED